MKVFSFNLLNLDLQEQIYIYTNEEVVEKVGFRFRKKNKFKLIDEVPHDKLLLSRELKLPKAVIVQVSFSPLDFKLLEG